MAWYDPILILVFIIGVLLLIFSHGANKRNVILGLVLVLGALVIKAFFWFESLL